MQGCSCAPSILRLAQEYGITEQGFQTGTFKQHFTNFSMFNCCCLHELSLLNAVYKAVNIGCAYLGSTYATGFLSSKCPPVSTYGSFEG